MAVHPPRALGGLEAALFMNPPAAAIGAGGDKLQRAGLKIASIDRHTGNIGGHGVDVNRRAGLTLRQRANHVWTIEEMHSALI